MQEVIAIDFIIDKYTHMYLLELKFECGNEEIYNSLCYSKENAERWARWLLGFWLANDLISVKNLELLSFGGRI